MQFNGEFIRMALSCRPRRIDIRDRFLSNVMKNVKNHCAQSRQVTRGPAFFAKFLYTYRLEKVLTDQISDQLSRVC